MNLPATGRLSDDDVRYGKINENKNDQGQTMAYIPSHKGRAWILPPNIEDMISEGHSCYLIEDLVEALDYTIQYSGTGHPAKHPKILLKILK